MGYHFRLYNGHQALTTEIVNGALWSNSYDSVKFLPMFSDWPVGFIYKGGVCIHHQSTSTAYDTIIGFNQLPTNHPSIMLASGSLRINHTMLAQRGIALSWGYRLEWRVEKINETQALVEYYINGEFVDQVTWTVGNNGSAYFMVRCSSNGYLIRCRDYYECENDEPFLRYWEFREVPIIAKPNQALTSTQLMGSYSLTQTTEVEAELDTRYIPDDMNVRGIVLEGNMRWRRRSPRHFTHRQFVLESNHLNYQQSFPEAAFNTGWTPVTPINDSIQPRLLSQLDTNVKLRWEMEMEE